MSETTPKKRGRPRSEASKQAILTAAAQLLQTEGYSGLTIEGVAAAACVGKMTVYRWWPAKAALVLDAVAGSLTAYASQAASNSPRTDLKRRAKALSRLLGSEQGKILLRLLGASQDDADLAKGFREMWLTPDRTAGIELVKRGMEKGEFDAKADPASVADAAASPVWYRALAGLPPLSDKALDQAIERGLAGFSA